MHPPKKMEFFSKKKGKKEANLKPGLFEKIFSTSSKKPEAPMNKGSFSKQRKKK